MDWACFLLATLDVALVHLVITSAIREAKCSNVELGLGSERGRKGLENGVFSLVLITKCKNEPLDLRCNTKQRGQR